MLFCGIKVGSPFFLAPMAAVTALPFRLMCRKLGAGLVITEQINATQIARNPDPFTNNEFYTIRTVPEEKPVGVQLFGVDEKDFISAVEIVEKNFELLNIKPWRLWKKTSSSSILTAAAPRSVKHPSARARRS